MDNWTLLFRIEYAGRTRQLARAALEAPSAALAAAAATTQFQDANDSNTYWFSVGIKEDDPYIMFSRTPYEEPVKNASNDSNQKNVSYGLNS